MGAEGTFRRAGSAMLDEQLLEWLRLGGRRRRPPPNAGNAFISFVNGLVYARVLTAIRTTALHSGVGFLHATMARQRYTLALDLAEPHKPMYAERLLLRMAASRSLRPSDFRSDAGGVLLSDEGRKRVPAAVRDELDQTVAHRALGRRVRYNELMRLDALSLTRAALEGEPFKPFRV